MDRPRTGAAGAAPARRSGRGSIGRARPWPQGVGWALLALALLARPAPAEARPDFSGTWRLDPAKSEFGRIPGGRPSARTDVIEQRGLDLLQTLYLDNGGRLDTAVYRYLIDSTEVVNRVGGSDIKSRVWWRGDTLRVESKARLLLVIETTLKEGWTLSAGGDTLTVRRRVTWPMGSGEQELVFERHPGPEAPAAPQPAERAPERDP